MAGHVPATHVLCALSLILRSREAASRRRVQCSLETPSSFETLRSSG
jgi:hypothetical protein